MRLHVIVGAAAAVTVLALPVSAEVTDRSPNGFSGRVVVEIAAPPAVVFDALVHDVGRWWDKGHTYSGDSKNLSIAATPGGCFCETLPGGGGVEHAVVVNVQPGALLRMRGALGPLQALGVSGSLSWQFEKAGTGTRLTFAHSVGGYVAGGLDALADAVDAVLARQVMLLKEYAEAAGPR